MSAGRSRRKAQKRSSNGRGAEAKQAPEREPLNGAEVEPTPDAPPAAESASELEAAAASAEPEAAEERGAGEDATAQEPAEEHAASEEHAEGEGELAQPEDSAAEVEAAEGEASEGEATPEGDAKAPAELDRTQQKAVLEALVFASERPVTAAQLARAMKLRAAQVRELVTELMQDYQGRGMELIEVAGGYQLRSAPACGPYVREFVAQKPVRLTRAQLETLALIAYRQPITRPEIDEIRGVDSGSAIRVLLERSLIKMLGRKDEPGRPLLYGTTSHFLEFFGMRSLKDLPTLREFTELNEENRALFKRKTGESVEQAEAELLAGEARNPTDPPVHVSDDELAELAGEAQTDVPPPPADEPASEALDDAETIAPPPADEPASDEPPAEAFAGTDADGGAEPEAAEASEGARAREDEVETVDPP